MAKTLTILHTTPVIVKLIGDLAKEILSQDVDVRQVVDDSLLNDTRKAGHMTKDVARRLVGYVQLAEAHGSDCVLLTCSSVSPAVDVARLVVNIPVLKIDEPMAEAAVALGNRIAVLATVPTTLGPTSELIRAAASKAKPAGAHDAPVVIKTFLCDDAFDALARGDVDRHNDLLLKHIVKAASEFDAVVLAQASMSNIIPRIPAEVSGRVLTSPRLGLRRTADVLARL